MIIDCLDPHGTLVPVPAAKITFRPAAYGLHIDGDRIVLQRDRHTGLWHPPGLIVPAGQVPRQALCAALHDLLRFDPLPGPLLLSEQQYRLDEEGDAWHLLLLYYYVSRSTGALSLPSAGPEAETPEWVLLSDINRQKMHFGYAAVRAARARIPPA